MPKVKTTAIRNPANTKQENGDQEAEAITYASSCATCYACIQGHKRLHFTQARKLPSGAAIAWVHHKGREIGSIYRTRNNRPWLAPG